MAKGSIKFDKKKLILILISVAVVFAVISLIVHQTTKITNESYVNCSMGDVNGDGYINSLDSLLVIQSFSDEDLLFDSQKKLADVNEDGEINSTDALILLRYSVNDISILPYSSEKQKEIDSLRNSRNVDCKTDNSYTLVQILNEWDNGDGTHSYQLNITVKNIGDKEIESWNSKILLSSAVTISKSWDCNSKTNQDELTVKGENIPSESAYACGLIVKAPEGLTIKKIATND